MRFKDTKHGWIITKEFQANSIYYGNTMHDFIEFTCENCSITIIIHKKHNFKTAIKHALIYNGFLEDCMKQQLMNVVYS